MTEGESFVFKQEDCDELGNAEPRFSKVLIGALLRPACSALAAKLTLTYDRASL